MVSNFIPIKEACDHHGLIFRTVTEAAFQHKDKTGEFPKWYKKEGRKAFIDIESLRRIGDLDIEVSQYITHPLHGLFWYLTHDLKIMETTLADICSEKSKKFKSAASWRQFFSNSMFSLRDKAMKVRPEYTMSHDFLVIMTRWVYDVIIVPNRDN